MYLMFQPLRKFLVVSGRARRKEYWLFFLFCFAAGVILPVIDMVGRLNISTGTLDKESGFGLLIGLFIAISVVPGITLSIRRLHDVDKSGWWILLSLIPVLGALCLLVLACLKGTPGENRFGEDPLASNLDRQGEIIKMKKGCFRLIVAIVVIAVAALAVTLLVLWQLGKGAFIT